MLRNLLGPRVVLLWWKCWEFRWFVRICSLNPLQPCGAARQIHWNVTVATQFLSKSETISPIKSPEICASHSSSHLCPTHSPPIYTTNPQANLRPNSVANNIPLLWYSCFKGTISSTRKSGISWPKCKPQGSRWPAISSLQVHLQVSSHRGHKPLPPTPPPLLLDVPSGDHLAVPPQRWLGQRAERDSAQLQLRAMGGKEVTTQQMF